MKEKMYLTDDIAILNFNKAYATTQEQIVKSDLLANFMMVYAEFLKKEDIDMYHWLLNGKSLREANADLCRLFKQIMVLELSEIDSYYLNDKAKLLKYIEGLYTYWNRHQRYSVTTTRFSGMGGTPFVLVDSNFNVLLRSTYRTLEQAVIGKKNKVYRNIQAGTNAAISCYQNRKCNMGERYEKLEDILFIEAVMLRTPMILRLKSNKRTGMFKQIYQNPVDTFNGNPNEYFCMPIKAGQLLIFVFFHRDFMAAGTSVANLFEIADKEETRNKPDGIIIFGNQDGKNETYFYHDEEEHIWVGSVSYHERMEYFGYMKKMILTIHNVAMMERGWLPIHGAFVNVTLKDGKKKGIMLMGDSGAGKSESIEAMKAMGAETIRNIEVVFDDMGSIHLEDGVPYGQGTEIGAFVRLDDLDPGTPYRDMDRSIFFNPDQSNARVITPAAPYDVVSQNHKIDLFCYANNYDDKDGMHQFEDMEEAKPVFVEGKRMAKGTTQEVGISTTYFANPFGPMQMQEVCQPLIDRTFDALKENGVYVGEIYTHLGLDPESRDGIHVAAKALLDFVEYDPEEEF